jgi:hypothetical protein
MADFYMCRNLDQAKLRILIEKYEVHAYSLVKALWKASTE